MLNVVLKFHDASAACTVIDVEDWSHGKGASPDAARPGEAEAPAAMPEGFVHERVRTGEVGAVHWALQAFPAAVNAPDASGKTPLHVAAALGHADICAFLTAHGADPNALDERRNTPLLLAAGAGHLAVVKVRTFHTQSLQYAC